MYVRLNAFWNAAFDLVRADDARVVDVDLKVFGLTGELWKNRMAGDDLVMGLRPAESVKGLRTTKAMFADRIDVRSMGRWVDERGRKKVREVVEAMDSSIT